MQLRTPTEMYHAEMESLKREDYQQEQKLSIVDDKADGREDVSQGSKQDVLGLQQAN